MVRKIIFVTGNQGKLKEARQILSDFEVENIKLDLPEFQGDRDKVIKEKAKMASQKLGKSCFVDDTSLCFTALNDLPGVYIRHFLDKLGRKGLISLLADYKDKTAKAVAMIGYCEYGKEPICFEGIIKGSIVEPRGEEGFGWDAIFQTDVFKKTYAELSDKEKNSISHRKKALEKFKRYLEENDRA
jgi:inosine triphosphate pyrophosphatase